MMPHKMVMTIGNIMAEGTITTTIMTMPPITAKYESISNESQNLGRLKN